MVIDGREVTEYDKYSTVTYVPGQAEGDAGHPDCEQGVLLGEKDNFARVLYCKSRTIQLTNPADLVWG